MIGSKWKMVAAAAAMAMLTALAAPRLAAAQDNGGGGGGACLACASNFLTGDSWCVTHGTGNSNLFGMTKCKTTKTYLPRGVLLGCDLSGVSCMSGLPIPLFPGYL